MRVLAFDIATQTGVAFGCVGSAPQSKVIDLGKGRSDAARFSKAIRMTKGFIDDCRPDLVAIEAPIGPGSSTVLIGLYACVVGEAYRMGCTVKRYQVQTIRKHFLGKALTARDFKGLT
ncbi:MAG: hypothetical protein KJN60_10085, partial [Boseongicola sp.]|nr:hypothetical protein [Boseongicola sp.]